MIEPKADHWRQVAEHYALEPEPFSVELAAEIAAILSKADFAPPAALLEAGCGSGHLSLELARRGFHADVLDFEPLAVEKARAAYQHALGKKSKTYKFIEGDLNDLKAALGGEQYDIVWNSGVLEHFSAERLRHVLEQMRAAARGAVFFIVPNPASLVYLAYRQKMLEQGRWPFGVEFLRPDYPRIAAAAGLRLMQSGFCGGGYTRNFLEYVVPEAEAAKHFNSLFAGQLAQAEQVLAWFLLEPAKPGARARGSQGNVPAEAETRDSELMFDKTFYVDAIGAANAAIMAFKQQIAAGEAKGESLRAALAEQLRQQALLLEELKAARERAAGVEEVERALHAARAHEEKHTATLEERQSLVQSLEARLRDKDQMITAQSDKLRDLGAELAHELQQRLEAAAEQKRLQDELQQAGLKLAAVEQLEHTLIERHNHISSLNARLLDKDQAVKRVSDQLHEQNQRLAQQMQERHDAEAALARLQGELAEQGAMRQQLAQKDDLLAERQGHIASLNARLIEKDQLAGTLGDQLRAEQQAAEIRGAQAEADREKLAGAEGAAAQYMEAIADLKIALATMRGEQVVLRDMLKEREARITEREAQGDAAKKLAARERQVEELEGALEQRGAEVVQTREQLSAQQKRNEQLAAQGREAQAAQKALVAAVDELRAAVAAAQQRAQELHALATTAQGDMQAQRNALGELAIKLNETESEFALLTAQMERELEQLRGERGTMAAALHELLAESVATCEEVKQNLHLKWMDANEAAVTLEQYQQLRRFKWAHQLHLAAHHLGHGPLRRRLAFVGGLFNGKVRRREGAFGEADTLTVPLSTIGKISEYLVTAEHLLNRVRDQWNDARPLLLNPEALAPGGPGAAGRHGRNVQILPPAATAAEKPRLTVPPELPRRPHGRRRVAYLTNQLLDWNDQRPRYGGGERYAMELARLLTELGLEVTFFQPACRQCEGRYENFKVVCFVPGEAFSEFSYGNCRRFTELAAGYDHVIHNLPEYSSGVIRQDALMICHGIWFDHDNYPAAKFRTAQWYEHLHNAFSHPRAIVSVDTNSINYIRAIWPALAQRLRYIPNFYRAQDFRPDPAKRNPQRLMVLFPRRSQVNRGSRILESILARVPHEVDFCWVGEGDPEDTEMIKALAQRDKRLTFHCADFAAMPQWYQRADITVIPTLACEGTSLSCLEALASGSATISTNVGGLSDLVQNGNNGLLVDPFPEAIAEAINLLIENPAERRRLERTGPESAQAFELQLWRRKWGHILLEQRWTTGQALAGIGLEMHVARPQPRWLRSGEPGAPRIGILTRNAIHGGVETIIELERRELNATVIVSGGVESPSTCPFPYGRADTYAELAEQLTCCDVVVYHWIHELALQAIQDAGLPSIEFVHRTDTAQSDKQVPTRVIAHSEFLADYITEEYGRACEVIEHPIDIEKFSPPAKLGNCIGAVTSLYPTKGLDIFLRAWATLAAQYPKLQVRFYGTGPERQNLEQLAAELGIAAQFLPPVRDPWRVLAEFCCFVLPSRLEGLPMTVLEAMAMDIPVVASDIPGVLEFNAQVERLSGTAPLTTFKSEDPADLARALKDELKRKRRPATNAYIRQHHSAAQHAARLRTVLVEALSQTPGPRRDLKLTQLWVADHCLAAPGDAEGVYLLELDAEGNMQQAFAASSPEFYAHTLSETCFPIMIVPLPRGTTHLEWQAQADTDAVIGWQIDWLADDFSSLGYQAGVSNIIAGKLMGGFARGVPPEAVRAKVVLRPAVGSVCRFQNAVLRAYGDPATAGAAAPAQPAVSAS